MASDCRSALAVGLVEVRVGVGEFLDHSLADGRGGRVFDVGAAEVAEELLVLDLDALPGRVADDAGESAAPARWSGLPSPSPTVKMPGNSRCQWKNRYWRASVRICSMTLSGRDCGFSDRSRRVAWVMPCPELWRAHFGLDEGGAPGVGDEFGGDEVGVVFQSAPSVGSGAQHRKVGGGSGVGVLCGPVELAGFDVECLGPKSKVSWSVSAWRSALLRALSLAVHSLSSSPRTTNAVSGMFCVSSAGVVPSRELPTRKWASRNGRGRVASKASSQSAALVISMARSLRSTP